MPKNFVYLGRKTKTKQKQKTLPKVGGRGAIQVHVS
jgi:hypothetical protein